MLDRSSLCPRCGAEVSSVAEFCGACQARIERSWPLGRLAVGLAGVILLAGAVFGAFWLKDSLKQRSAAREAIREVGAALEQAQSACEARGTCPEQVPQARSALETAKQASESGDYAGALAQARAAGQTLAQAGNAEPQGPDPTPYDEELRRADQEMTRGDDRAAVDRLLHAISMRPDRTEARQRLESLRLRLRDIALMPSTSAGVPPPVTPPPVAAPPLTSPSVRAGMALIPGGGFIMGAPEGAGASDEHPQHKVWLDAFYLDTDEVSVEEYRKFCAQTDRPMPEQPDWSSPRHPVVNVSWHNADAFCRHRGQRLPTEAQWERGALCGGTRRKSDAPLVGNMVTTDPLMKSQTAGSPWPVGTKGPNPCGFFDSVGNVWEWVSDWYSANYYDQSPRRNPAGPAQGEEKVLRGGAVLSPAAALTGTFREKFSADYGAEDRGFRCAAPASD